LLSFDFSLRIFLAQAGQYLDAPEPGTYSTPHTVQFLAGIAAHRFVGMICNSSTKPMNLVTNYEYIYCNFTKRKASSLAD
jgi:hypothetical protein